MEFDLNLTMILILSAVALVAGFVDSIAGGGGMITLPALMFAGIPPHEVLGTNKFQGVFGTLSATWHFYKNGHLDLRKCALFAGFAFVFALGGVVAVQIINADILRKAIPFLLIFFALYFLFSPKVSEDSSKARISRIALAFVIGGIGFYDGFFGPGTGSFLMIALISLGGFGIKDALAQAKLYNFATNLASVIAFAVFGHILFAVGAAMAVGQFIGGNLGAKMALKYGIKIIKPLVVIISLAMCAKLLFFS